MDKTSIINNIQNKILIKNFSEWNHESIDNLLLIFRYSDCSEYYEDVLSLFKEYLQWRREGKDFNNENNYSTKKLIAVYLKLEELLLNNHYIYYEDIYDTLHNHSVQDLISEYSHLFLPIFCFFMVFVRILTFVPRKHNIKYDYNYDYNYDYMDTDIFQQQRQQQQQQQQQQPKDDNKKVYELRIPLNEFIATNPLLNYFLKLVE
jgi:hypothetical protein